VEAVAVGAFGDQAIDAAGISGSRRMGSPLAAQIHGVGDAHVGAVVLDIEHDDGAAEHVAGVEQLEHDAGGDDVRAAVGQADDLARAGR
jgi:hypothetical protein